MQEACSMLKAALAEATFADADVQSAVSDLISTLEGELDAVGFEPGTDLEETIIALESALNEADTDREDLDAVADDAIASDDEEEDADDRDDGPEV